MSLISLILICYKDHKIGDFSIPNSYDIWKYGKKHLSLLPTISVPYHKNRKNKKGFYFSNASLTVPLYTKLFLAIMTYVN